MAGGFALTPRLHTNIDTLILPSRQNSQVPPRVRGTLTVGIGRPGVACRQFGHVLIEELIPWQPPCLLGIGSADIGNLG